VCQTQLVTMRVECEKAWQSAAGEPLWDALGDRASGAMHIVRAYNERFLQSAYSGLLPPQPHHPSGECCFLCDGLRKAR